MVNLLSAIPEDAAGIWNLVIQYGIYAVIIVVSIVALILLRKYTRLPRHSEFRKKLAALGDEIKAIDPAEKRMDFLKSVTRAIYNADNLAYVAAMLAEKERYADLSRISTLIEEARGELSPYKYGKKEAEEDDGIKAAEEKIQSAIDVLDKVIERDGSINAKIK